MSMGGSNMRNRSFDAGVVFRHPVFLVTFLLALIGWFVAFIGMCVAESDLNNLNGGPSMGTLWFAIIFQFAIIVHLFIALARNALALHRWQIAIVTAVVVVFAINGVEMIYQGQARDGLSSSGALKAVGAGWLLCALADLVWILYLTSEEDTFFYHLLNPTGLAGLTPYSAHRYGPTGGVSNTYHGAETGGDYPSSRMMNGTGTGGGILSSNGNGNGYASGGYAPAATTVKVTSTGMGGGNGGGAPVVLSAPVGAESGMMGDMGHVMRAKALYAYTASPDDPTEISFNKGEILEITDATGKWWQCKTAAGNMGIAPSNYLQIV